MEAPGLLVGSLMFFLHCNSFKTREMYDLQDLRRQRLHVAWEKLDNPVTAIKFREVTMINIKQLTNQGLSSIKDFSKAM
jgi:hypothetical protein